MHTTSLPSPTGNTATAFGHPRGLSTLFFTEMWERFSFYGMRALLTLYLVAPPDGATPPGGGLGLTAGDATAIYGTYLALVYVFPLVGGWIADRLWGSRRAVLVGGIIIAVGHFIMAASFEVMFWLGLLLIAMGTGLLKPCVSSIVGGLYAPGDGARRDAGFSIFYMGINLGAFAAPLVTGTLAQQFDWHWGFIAAGIGMTIGIIQYLLGSKYLGNVGIKPPNPATPEVRRKAIWFGLGALSGLSLAVAAVSALRGGFHITDIVDMLTVIVLIIPVVYFWKLFRNKSLSGDERSRVKAFLFLFLASAVFWMIFDQAGSTLNLFAQHSADRDIFFGWEMPAAWLQSVNPIFIIIFAPIFAIMWSRLANRAPSTPMKFGISVVGIGISFWVMVLPGLMADNGQLSSVWWLIGVYLIQTWAELLISPTGLSTTTALAPRGMESQLLALWFLATAVGDAIGGQLARVLEGLGTGMYFAVTGGAAVLFGIAMLILAPAISRMMKGVR